MYYGWKKLTVKLSLKSDEKAMYPLSWSRRHKEYRSPVHMLQHSEHTSLYQTNLKKPPYYLVCRCGEDSEVRRSLLGQPGRSSCTLPSSSCIRCSWQLQSRWRRANKREREKNRFRKISVSLSISGLMYRMKIIILHFQFLLFLLQRIALECD